jgi:hypothetical protein
VALDRGPAHVQLSRNLPARKALGQESEDLRLALAQSRTVRRGPQTQLAGQRRLHLRRQHDLSPRHDRHRFADLDSGALFRQ